VIQIVVVVSATVVVLRRLGVSVAVGALILDDVALSELALKPADLIVVGMVTIPAGTSPELVRSAVRSLRVLGLLEGDLHAIRALAGKATVFGATHSRDA
jgi:hypothetical protein